MHEPEMHYPTTGFVPGVHDRPQPEVAHTSTPSYAQMTNKLILQWCLGKLTDDELRTEFLCLAVEADQRIAALQPPF